MQALVITLVVVACAAFVVWIVRYSRRQEAALVAVWNEFARRGGHRWIDASGPWYRRVHAHVDGEREGVAFVLERFWVSNGKSSTVYTRVRATLRDGPRERVLVRPNSWLHRAITHFAAPRATTGDANFDQRWLVRCKAPEVVRKLVDARVRELLLGFKRSAHLDVSAGKLAFWWHGSEADSIVLDRAVDIAVRIAHASARR